jgi:sec-independent protein translocase protein TatA
MDFLGIGPFEVLLILLIAFIIFGPQKLMEMSKTAGKTMRELSRSASALSEKLNQEIKIDGLSIVDKPEKPDATDKVTKP